MRFDFGDGLKRVWIAVALAVAMGAADAQNLSGDWQGHLRGKTDQRLMLQIVKTDSGVWEAALYRIDAGGEPEFVPSVKVQGGKLQLQFGDGSAFDGALNADAKSISGVWKDAGSRSEPMTWERATKERAWQNLDSDVDPPVSVEDIKIVERAKVLLNSPAKWNRADNRECPDGATTFSMYCALDRATVEVSGRFAHRGAAMQEARFVIDEELAKGNHYEHRLMDYNNDPRTTFADTQRFFQLVEERIEKRLHQTGPQSNN